MSAPPPPAGAGPRGRDGAAKSLGGELSGFEIDPDGQDAGKALIVDIGHLCTRVALAGREDGHESLTAGGRVVDTPGDCMVITDPDMRSTGGTGFHAAAAAGGGGGDVVRRTWEGFEAHLADNVFGPILQRDGTTGEVLGDRPLLLVEQALTQKAYREKPTQIAFETFDAPMFYLSQGSVLGLYATGRTTGMVVDLGYAGASVCPVYEGYALPHAARHAMDLGGERMNERLADVLAAERDGLARPTQGDLRFLREGNSEVKTEDSYQLPDGTAIPAERLADEYFFEGKDFTGKKVGSLSEEAYECIMRCDVDIRMDLYANMIFIGGGAGLFGLKERFTKGVAVLAPPRLSSNVKTVRLPNVDPGDSAVKGGSILAGLSTFSGLWISKAEYDDAGPSIVHRKCF